MEEKINVAAILKDKPKGTKLYSVQSDGACFLSKASEDSIYIDIDNRKRFWCFSAYGSTHSFPNGCVLLFPSKEMRDWSKFAWKRGDVLLNSSGFKLFFDRWANDEYTRFFGKVNLLEDSFSYETEKYTLASKEETLDTLEIEKPEFKDGDIVVYKCEIDDVPSTIFIFRGISQRTPYYSYYASLDSDGFLSYKLGGFGIYKRELRLATEEEKEQLFSALKKKGKAWDGGKKAIVDLKPKIELKPFDNVLVRDSESDKWRANLFGYIGKDGYYYCVYANWAYCIPYIGNESLLGTTKDVEG